MSWKKKEKPLTHEEAVELAKKELAPFWFGAEPFLAGVRDPATGRATAHPLDKTFAASSRLMFFFDPLTHAGSVSLIYAREWRRRFKALGLDFMLVLKPSFAFMRERSYILSYLENEEMEVPTVMDADGALFAAFGAKSEALPRVVLVSEGKIEFAVEGKTCCQGFEVELHRFLRRKDPGLPLAPAFDPAAEGHHFQVDTGVIDLGEKAKPVFVGGAFAPNESGARVASFSPLEETPSRLKPGEIRLHGSWIQEPERISTTDSQAAISIRLPAGGLGLIAESHGGSLVDEALIEVAVAERPAWDSIAGKGMTLSDEGRSLLKPQKPAVIEVLRNVREADRMITLRFPTAQRAAVGIYSIRFASTV